MLAITEEDSPGGMTLRVSEDDVEVAVLKAIKTPDGWKINHIRIEKSRRNDDALAEALYPMVIAKVIDLGWITENDLPNYKYTPEGIECGSLKVNLPQQKRDNVLRFRTVARDEVEKVAERKNVTVKQALTPEVAAVKEFARLEKEAKGAGKPKK